MDVGSIEAAFVVRDLATQQLRKAQGELEKLNKTLGRSQTDAEKTAGAWDSLSKRLTKSGEALATVGRNLSLYVTAPIVAVGGAAVKMAADFEHEITKIETLVGINRDTLNEWSDDILRLSTEVGKSPEELAKALFVVTSAGTRGAEAMEILAEAGKASALGLGDTAEIARSVTAAMQAYGKENLDAGTATRTLIATVREGNLEASELAGTLGRVIGIASQVGVSFQELGSFIATFTRLGVDSAEAVTGLRGMLSTLIKPSEGAREQLIALGTSIEELRAKVQQQGLTAAMTDLATATRGNIDAIGEIIPNVRALSGFLGTAGAQAEAFATIQKNITDIAADQTFTDRMLVETKKTLTHQLQELRAATEAVAVKFGTALLPLAKALVSALHPLVTVLELAAKAFGLLPMPVQAALVALTGFVALAGPTIWMFSAIEKSLGMMLAKKGFQAVASGVALLYKELRLLMGLQVSQSLSTLAVSTTSVARGAMLAASPMERLGTALGTILAPLVNLVTKFPLLNSAAGMAMSAIGLLAKAVGLLLTPWGLLVTSVAALTAAFVYVTDLGGPLKNLFSALSEAVGEFVGLIEDTVAALGRDLVSAAKKAKDAVAGILPKSVIDGWELFKQNAKLAIDDVTRGVKDMTAAMKAWRDAVNQPTPELMAVAGTEKKPWWMGDNKSLLDTLRAGGGGAKVALDTADALALLNKELGGNVVLTKEIRQAQAQWAYDLETIGLPTLKKLYVEGKAAGMSVEEIAESTKGGLDITASTFKMLEDQMKKSEEATKASTAAGKANAKAAQEMRDWWNDVNLELGKTTRAQTAAIIDNLTDRMKAMTEPLRTAVALFGQLREQATTIRVDISLGSGGIKVLDWMRQYEEQVKALTKAGEFGAVAMQQLQETAGADLQRLTRDVDFATLGFESMAEMIAYIGAMSGIDYSKFLPTEEQWGKLLPSKTLAQDLGGTLFGFLGQGIEKKAAVGGLGKKLIGAFGSPAELGAGLSSTIMGALTGGGDVGKSIGGFLGEAIGEGFGSTLKGAIGDVLKDIVPAIGALIGSRSGGLASVVSAGMQTAFGGLSSHVKGLTQVTDGVKSLTTKGKVLGGAMAGVGAAFTGLSLTAETGSKAMGALGGAATGAMQGFMMGGPIGAAIGGIAGALGGLFGDTSKKTRKMRDEFIASAGGIDKVREMATYAGVSIDKLLSTKKAKTFEAEVKKLEAAFAAAQERVKALLGDLQQVTTEGGIVGKELWQRLIKDADKAEVKEAFTSFFKAQADKAAEGFNKIASGWAALMEKGGDATTLLTIPLERVGVLAEAAFGAMLAKGASLLEAITAVSPGLDRIVATLERTGGTAEGMLGQLLGWRNVIEQNKELFEVLSGVDDMLVGLGNTGLLTQEAFDALTQTMTDAFDTLVAQGTSGEDALRLMQPQLQKLWELQRMWGLEISDTTQAMLDQAVEQGIVGEKMKSVNDKILDVLISIGEVLGAKIPEGLRTFEQVARESARGVQDALSTIKPPVLKGRVMWDVDSLPELGRTDLDLQTTNSFASGTRGLRDFGSGTLAMLHGREAVVPADEYTMLLAGGEGAAVDLSGVVDEIAAMRQEQAAASAALPSLMARSLRDAMLLAGGG